MSDKFMPSLQINDLLEELETRANTILTQAQSTLVQTEPVQRILEEANRIIYLIQQIKQRIGHGMLSQSSLQPNQHPPQITTPRGLISYQSIISPASPASPASPDPRRSPLLNASTFELPENPQYQRALSLRRSDPTMETTLRGSRLEGANWRVDDRSRAPNAAQWISFIKPNVNPRASIRILLGGGRDPTYVITPPKLPSPSSPRYVNKSSLPDSSTPNSGRAKRENYIRFADDSAGPQPISVLPSNTTPTTTSTGASEMPVTCTPLVSTPPPARNKRPHYIAYAELNNPNSDSTPAPTSTTTSISTPTSTSTSTFASTTTASSVPINSSSNQPNPNNFNHNLVSNAPMNDSSNTNGCQPRKNYINLDEENLCIPTTTPTQNPDPNSNASLNGNANSDDVGARRNEVIYSTPDHIPIPKEVPRRGPTPYNSVPLNKPVPPFMYSGTTNNSNSSRAASDTTYYSTRDPLPYTSSVNSHSTGPTNQMINAPNNVSRGPETTRYYSTSDAAQNVNNTPNNNMNAPNPHANTNFINNYDSQEPKRNPYVYSKTNEDDNEPTRAANVYTNTDGTESTPSQLRPPLHAHYQQQQQPHHHPTPFANPSSSQMSNNNPLKKSSPHQFPPIAAPKSASKLPPGLNSSLKHRPMPVPTSKPAGSKFQNILSPAAPLSSLKKRSFPLPLPPSPLPSYGKPNSLDIRRSPSPYCSKPQDNTTYVDTKIAGASVQPRPQPQPPNNNVNRFNNVNPSNSARGLESYSSLK